MCDCNVACFQTSPRKKYRKLTLLLLDCWQREYDKRPYRNFNFQRLDFENRMGRSYDPVRDFAILIQFIKSRSLCGAKLQSLTIVSYKTELIRDFVESLSKLTCIELKLMSLPTELFEALEQNVGNMKVKQLVLKGTPLNNNHILCLRSFLIKSKTLQCLNVSACCIDQYNFANLADGVHKSESVVAFNGSRLLGNHLSLDTEKIAMVVSSLIWQNHLEELEMQMCEFNAQDMEIIAEYLYNKSCRLDKLNVAFNKFGPDGARYLLKAISSSGTLKYLDMSGCDLGSHGGEYAAQYLSSCARLESLVIQFNDMDAEVVSSILLTMKKPLKLSKLYLWGNRYNSRTGTILRRLIDSRVMPKDSLDITYTFDDTIPGYRVIPWRP